MKNKRKKSKKIKIPAPQTEAPAWVFDLDEDTLISIALQNTEYIDAKKSIDSIGYFQLPVAIDGLVGYADWPDYWEQFKRELQVFFCSQDKKYSELRRQLSESGNKSQTAVVSTIAAAMAVQFGVVAGALVPFVAMSLVVIARIGWEAFCKNANWDIPLKPDNPKEETEG